MYIQRGVEAWTCGMAMCEAVAVGVDQSPREHDGVPLSLVHSGRCLGRLLRCDVRTLGRQRICCYEKQYLICAQDRIGMLILVWIWPCLGDFYQRDDCSG
jgi:hypothetical protein